MSAELDPHYETMTRLIQSGRLVFFLGAGANLCDLPPDWSWTPRQRGYLPSGRDLAEYLARLCHSGDERILDLARVAQCVAVTAGDGALYWELRELFDADYSLTPLHTFIATRPAALRALGVEHCYQLVMTTNYDDLMERAFEDAGEPYDVLVYMADNGHFVHRTPIGDEILIERGNEYADVPLGDNRTLKRPLIVKLHGTVDRRSDEGDSYVITEDDYIDYLARRGLSALLPQIVHEKLKRSHFLFLGYGLRDWNLRVILHRIWGEQRLTLNSWAVQLNPGELEEKFWSRRNVEILSMQLLPYLQGWLDRWPQPGAAEWRGG